MQKHPNSLEYYSFIWSEIRLVIAAIALFMGGIPPLAKIGIFAPGFTQSLLTLCWIISGVAAVYLIYEYFLHKRIFGSKKPMDLAAFWVMVISGLNLGIAGVTKNNIGMSISSSYFIFVVVGIIYLCTAYYMYNRFKESGKKLF